MICFTQVFCLKENTLRARGAADVQRFRFHDMFDMFLLPKTEACKNGGMFKSTVCNTWPQIEKSLQSPLSLPIISRAKHLGMMADDVTTTKPPSENMMVRTNDVMRQKDAVRYASQLSTSQRTDVGGCYALKCVPCGLCTIGLHYVSGSQSSMCWGCGTIPFACCALPLSWKDPYWISVKRDMTIMVVDGERQTLACYPGELAENPCCVWTKVGLAKPPL
jgi:hypothetical protein